LTSEDPFVGDTGPGFDPDVAAATAGEVRADAEAELREPGLGAFELPEVAEESVRDVLRNAGDMTHALVGVGEQDWRATQTDCDRIAPPLTRIVNRYQVTRAVAQKSDEAALIIGFGMYGWRSMLERQAVLSAQERNTVDAPAVDVHPHPAPPRASGEAPAMTVVPGYKTNAERIREAQERTPDAQPRQDPPTA
jgi:hypothetical protein